MKITILILTLFQIATAFGQYSITSVSNPSPGDIKKLNSYNVNTFSPPASGANNLWDYSTLTFTGSAFVITHTFVAVSNVPNSNSFTAVGANLGVLKNPNDYDVLKCDNSARSKVGFYDPSTGVYGNDMMYFPLPFAYGDIHQDEFKYTSVNRNGSGTLESNAIGTGTLLLQSFTLPDVLLIHTHIIDSSFAPGNTNPMFTYTLNQYAFYSPASKFELFSIEKKDYDFITSTASYTNMFINQQISVTGLETVTPSGAEFEVFHNPISQQLVLNIETGNCPDNLQLFNLYGHLIREKEVEPNTKGTLSISTRDLADGVYFIRLQSASATKKILITTN